MDISHIEIAVAVQDVRGSEYLPEEKGTEAWVWLARIRPKAIEAMDFRV
jgi:hypothetical protein